jgi:hypothetical protein
MFLTAIPRRINYQKRGETGRPISAVKDLLEATKQDKSHVYEWGKFCQFFDDFVYKATMHLPNVEFVMTTVSSSKYELVVFYKDDLCEMGRLSTTYYDGNLQYHVQSQAIQNQRYCPHNSPDDHHTLSSKNVSKAVANARRYLRPNTMSDIARSTHDNVEQRVMRHRGDTRSERTNRAREVGFDVNPAGHLPDIAQTVIDMHRMGLMTVDEELDRKLGKMYDAIDEYDKLLGEDDEYMTCVWIKNDEIQMHPFDVHYRHASQATRVSRGQAPWDESFGRHPYTIPRNELPDSVADRVAVLDVLGVNDFVYDVGVKLSDSVYYVRYDWGYTE